MIPGAHFGKATECFEFFEQLKPNTDVHWSADKNAFVLTGGAWAGCDHIANSLHGYKPQDTIAKLKEIANEMFLLLSIAVNAAEQYQIIIDLRSKFTRAVTGSSSYDRFGGLQGLSEKYERQEKEEIQHLILEIDSKLEETLEVMTATRIGTNSSLMINPPNIQPEQYTDEEWQEKMAQKPEASPPKYTKYFLYNVTLIYNIAYNSFGNGPYTWWNDVSYNESESILLGAIPLIGSIRNDLKTLGELGIKAVLSVVEPFEIETKGLLGSPVTSDQWQEYGIKHLHISTPDFQPLTQDDIFLGVEFIRWNVKNGRSVYIHCKAGKARSALIVICYLIKEHSLSFIQALKFIKTQRQQMHLDEGKLNNAYKFELWCKSLKK